MENLKKKVNENKEIKKNKILTTSFNLFTKNGINNTTIQDIVDDAGLAKGTFYLYFKDKYEVQDELIVKKSCELFDNAMRRLAKANIDNFVDQIIFIIDYIINYLSRHKLLLKFISKNLSWGIYNEKINKIMDNNNLGIYDLFINGVKKNNINLVNADVTLFMIIELVSSTCFSSIIKSEPLPISEYKPFLYEEIKKMLKQQ